MLNEDICFDLDYIEKFKRYEFGFLKFLQEFEEILKETYEDYHFEEMAVRILGENYLMKFYEIIGKNQIKIYKESKKYAIHFLKNAEKHFNIYIRKCECGKDLKYRNVFTFPFAGFNFLCESCCYSKKELIIKKIQFKYLEKNAFTKFNALVETLKSMEECKLKIEKRTVLKGTLEHKQSKYQLDIKKS